MTKNMTNFPFGLNREELLYLIDVLQAMADELADNDTSSDPAPTSSNTPDIVLYDMNQCLEAIEGIKYNSLYRLVRAGKIKSIRSGLGEHGKYLVYKDSLLEYYGHNS